MFKSQGQDYYGNPINFVPTLSLGTIQTFVDGTLLPSMGILEANYDKIKSTA